LINCHILASSASVPAGKTGTHDIASPREPQTWSSEFATGFREVDDADADEEDDEVEGEVEDDDAASATPQTITIAMKIPARAAEFANEDRESAVRLMALGKPTSWLRRKNIPQVA
jgi:hypothetical protein